jgi:hypothetical protein
MRHDLGTVSARDWRAAREGEAHAASRTSESFIVGIGASGGLLAGAAIVFVTLLGIVSFNVWPSAVGISSSGPNVELTSPSGGGSGGGGKGAPLSAASGQLASVSVPIASPAGGGGGAAGGGGGGSAGGGGGNGGNQGDGSAGGSFGAGSPPPSGSAPATPPSSGGGSGGGSDEGPQPGTGEPIPGNDTKAPSGREDDRSNKDPLPDQPTGNGNDGDGNGNDGDGNGNDGDGNGNDGDGNENHGNDHGDGNYGNQGQSSDTPTAPPLGGSGDQSDDSSDSSDDSNGNCRAGRTDGIATTTLTQPPRPAEAPASGPDVAGATAAATGTKNR